MHEICLCQVGTADSNSTRTIWAVAHGRGLPLVLETGKGEGMPLEEAELPHEENVLAFEFLLFISQKGRDTQQSVT